MYNMYIMSAEKDTEMLGGNNNLKDDKFVESNIEEIDTWDELDLKPDILRGIYAHGLEKPSPIQRKAVKPIMDGKDIIAQAQSGTGKTATFTIGALTHVVIENNETQILVLSPTRELSKQTQDVMYGIGAMMPGLRVQLLVGGNSIDDLTDQIIGYLN